MKSEFSLAAVGQSLIKRDIRSRSQPAFRKLVEIIKNADLAFTNLEGTIKGSHGGWPTKAGYFCAFDPIVLDTLTDIGFNVMSLSNNHAFDLGPNGILSTLDEVAKRGVLHAGIGIDLTHAARPQFRDFPIGRVALIAMDGGPAPDDYRFAKNATTRVPARPGVNPQRVKSCISVTSSELSMLRSILDELGHDRKMSDYHRGDVEDQGDTVLNFYGQRFVAGPSHVMTRTPVGSDLARNLGAISDAAEQADFVVVYMHHHHWEATIEDTPDWSRVFAKSCIDAGADIYISHGVPLVQGIEIYRGRPIFHSLGNFIFHASDPPEWHNAKIWKSVVATCRFDTGGRVRAIELDPISIGTREALLNGDFSDREAPYLADPDSAAEVLEEIASLSRRFGTAVDIKGSRAHILIDHAL